MEIKKLIIEGLEYPDYEEIFKDITYPKIKPDKYMISNHGRVLNKSSNKIMKTYYDDDNHEKITLVIDEKHPTKRGNKSRHFFIHRLMAWEFLGPPPDELHNKVNHKNGVPFYNYIHNIEWTSVLENTNHAKRIGLMNNSGLNSANCKYSEDKIRHICSLFESGYNNIEIFEILNGHKNYKSKPEYMAEYNLINKLGKRIIFRDIVSDYNYIPDINRFNNSNENLAIRKMIIEGKTNYQIMNEFGYDDVSGNKKIYNKIISERVNCEVLFNDYRKYNLREKLK